MSKFNLNLLENSNYEVLITSRDKTVNTKPFGIQFKNNMAILNLYPNKTLQNLRNNSEFLIQFTHNPLTYTKALLNKLTKEDYAKHDILKTAGWVFNAQVSSFNHEKYEDNYGRVIKTEVLSNIINAKQLANDIPAINRATNVVIDLLVDYSRFSYFNSNQRKKYIDKLNNSELFIEKTGNNLHKESLKLLKKEILEE